MTNDEIAASQALAAIRVASAAYMVARRELPDLGDDGEWAARIEADLARIERALKLQIHGRGGS